MRLRLTFSRHHRTLLLLTVVTLGTALAIAAGAASSDNTAGAASAAQPPPTSNVLMGGSKYTGTPKGETATIVYVSDTAGKLGSFGPSVLHGLQLMEGLANKDGGIMGQPVKLYTADDQADPARAAQLTRTAIATQKPKAIFGDVLSSGLLAQAPLADQAKVPLFTTSASVTDFIQKDASIYNAMTLATSRQDGCGFAKFVGAKHPEWKRIALLVVGFAYGTDTSSNFKTCLKKYSPQAKIVATKSFQIGNQDFTPYINALLGAKPDFIFGVIFGTDAVRFYQQYRGAGGKVPFAITATDLESTQALAKQGSLPRHFDYDMATRTRYTELGSTAKPWITAYQKAYGSVPSGDALQAIAAFLAYKAAVEKAGTFDSLPVMQAYRCLTYYEPRGWVTVRTLNGQVDVPETFGAFQASPAFKDLRMDPTDSLKVYGHEVWLSDSQARATMPGSAVMASSECNK